MEIAEFLLARIAEEEAVARDAHYDGQRWYSEEEIVGRWPEPCDCDPPVLREANRKIEAEHIANWDPARVLAECEAKRRIVESARHTLFDDPLRRTDFWRGARDVAVADLRFLALPYADHPDYRQEWKP